MGTSTRISARNDKTSLEIGLSQVIDQLQQLNEKLNSLIEINNKMLRQSRKTKKTQAKPIKKNALTPDTLSILSLPLSLRKTIMVLYSLEKATADDLARETQRLRAVESASANELVRMGYICKKREGRDVYFFLNDKEEDGGLKING